MALPTHKLMGGDGTACYKYKIMFGSKGLHMNYGKEKKLIKNIS